MLKYLECFIIYNPSALNLLLAIGMFECTWQLLIISTIMKPVREFPRKVLTPLKIATSRDVHVLNISLHCQAMLTLQVSVSL